MKNCVSFVGHQRTWQQLQRTLIGCEPLILLWFEEKREFVLSFCPNNDLQEQASEKLKSEQNATPTIVFTDVYTKRQTREIQIISFLEYCKTYFHFSNNKRFYCMNFHLAVKNIVREFSVSLSFAKAKLKFPAEIKNQMKIKWCRTEVKGINSIAVF